MTAEIVLDAVAMTIRLDDPRDFGTPPSLAEMEAMAYQEFEHIPEELRSRCLGVAIRQSTFDIRHQPDIIFLYRRAILDYWCEGTDDLRAVVRHVLIHEIGHHFGFSDDDMHRIERAAGKS